MTPSSQNDQPAQDLSRRGIIKTLMGFSIIATLGGVLTPIVGFLWPPARKAGGSGEPVKVTTLSELRGPGGMLVSVGSEAVIVTISDGGDVKAFSAICTHLGCVSKWEPSGSYIVCPCHDGRFNAQTGAVISGPPPAPLPPREAFIDGEDVYVVS